MEQDIPHVEEQVETGKTREEKKPSLVKRIFCVVLGLALLAVSCFIWCKVWNGKGTRALESGDLSAAAEAYGKDFLLGGGAQAKLIRSTEDAYERGDYEQAAEGYAQLGESAREKWMACIHQLSIQACDMGEYAAAIAYAEQIGEEKRDVWYRSKAGLGSEAFAKQDYALAEQLFIEAGDAGADGWADVQLVYGDKAFAAKQYSEAAAYYEKAEEKGRELWSEACYREGKLLIQNGKPNEAIKCLKRIENETRAKQQIGLAQFMIAQDQASAGQYELAIRTAKDIQDGSLVDVPAFLEETYYKNALYQFSIGQLSSAMDNFRQCSHNEKASLSATILEKLLDEKDLLQAARLVAEAAKSESTDIAPDAWKDVILSLLPEYSDEDLDRDLGIETTKAVFAEPITFDQCKELLKDNVPKGEFYGSFSDQDKEYFRLKSLDALYQGDYGALGTQPSGKCLIVVCRTNVRDRTNADNTAETKNDYAVSMDLMRCLPPELFPTSLSEVEYIVLLVYSHTFYGYYTLLTEALQENGQVEVYQLPNKNRIFTTPNVKGDLPPQSFSYYIPPQYKSGGAPDLSGSLTTALIRIHK